VRDKICTKLCPFTCCLISVFVRDKVGPFIFAYLQSLNVTTFLENGGPLIVVYLQSLYVTKFVQNGVPLLAA